MSNEKKKSTDVEKNVQSRSNNKGGKSNTGVRKPSTKKNTSSVKTVAKKSSKPTSSNIGSKSNNSTVTNTKRVTNSKKVENNSGINKFKEFITSIKTLRVIFVLLLILVIILGVLVFKKDREEKNKVSADIVIPILDTNTNSEFSINAKLLSEAKEYIFKIANYKKEKVSKKKIKYKVEIVNGTNCVIELKKKDSKKDLMKEQNNTVVEGKLGNSEKEDVYYYVRITSSKKLKNGDLINIKVSS